MVPTLEVFSFSATTLEVFPKVFFESGSCAACCSHMLPYLEKALGTMTRFGSGSLRVFKPKSSRLAECPGCRGVGVSHLLLLNDADSPGGRPQAPAGEPRRRCCTSTAPPGAPTTSMGVPAQPMGSRLWMRRRGGTDVRQSILSSQGAVLRRRRRPQRSASAAR